MSEEDSNNLAIQIANLLKNGVQTQTQNPKPNPSDSLKINLNLTSQNYPLWARMIRVAIGGKSKALLNHLTKDYPLSTFFFHSSDCHGQHGIRAMFMIPNLFVLLIIYQNQEQCRKKIAIT
uniref:Gag-polypeptide of LTR copia-type n=1 Tax=Helianthus annuus TaxID=4232 RepID=A0A251VCI5_HELAN